MIADKIVGLLGSNPNPILLLLVIFLVTCVLTNFMSNTATTALMIPIAVSLANSLGADPRSVVIATVIAGSCAYATPIGMPANTMVVGLGGYKFKDYVKSGLPSDPRILCNLHDTAAHPVSFLSMISIPSHKQVSHTTRGRKFLALHHKVHS